jgi:hypothetical protein
MHQCQDACNQVEAEDCGGERGVGREEVGRVGEQGRGKEEERGGRAEAEVGQAQQYQAQREPEGQQHLGLIAEE